MATRRSDDSSGRTRSPWMRTAEIPGFAPLTEDVRADVCVVGAGIAGLSTAWCLVRAGRSVVVLEDGSIASGETGRTTAHLTTAFDGGYAGVERFHGERGARLAAESHARAIDWIEATVGELAIDCDFERLDGWLFGPPESEEDLRREFEACTRAGVRKVSWSARSPLPSLTAGPCLRFPRQAQFHPLRYLARLAQEFVRRGGRIFEHTHADVIEGGTAAQVRTAAGRTVRAKWIVVATNAPVSSTLRIPARQAGYRTYVIGGRVPQDTVPRALFWDTADPYHYVRLASLPGRPPRGPGHDLLLVGGEDHKTGQPGDSEPVGASTARFRRLARWAREHFPTLAEIDFRWSGQVMAAVDGLAYIGRNPGDEENVFIATGDSGLGMTHGTIAGLLISDLIQGRENPWTVLYDPSRLSLRALPGMASEAFDSMMEYGRWMTPGDVDSVEQIPRGAGRIVRDGLSKLACHRDEHGELHWCSAVCPHLGGIVAWNATEGTWDCPCHGSRFLATGEVVQGPANRNLEPGECPADRRLSPPVHRGQRKASLGSGAKGGRSTIRGARQPRT